MGSPSSAFKHSDLALVCQQQGDIIFVIAIVDSCVPESSGQMVLLPVVVPVSILVCPKAKHTDLEGTKLMAVKRAHKVCSFTLQLTCCFGDNTCGRQLFAICRWSPCTRSTACHAETNSIWPEQRILILAHCLLYSFSELLKALTLVLQIKF